ncbi:hypothetical protein [Neisseria iguanae]|uniref:Uncharacterized protein n=1 Tax=Neisseria iguanae TaxID=90242 RepID=A0A2P7U186_9NEIS|nr:hypothetical protein [Neisseria iguanae]PSJ80727.1 hypothetical protein C7N83_04645 [Neisseria iguanae]
MPLFEITFIVGTGVLFAAEGKLTVFLYPAGILSLPGVFSENTPFSSVSIPRHCLSSVGGLDNNGSFGTLDF